MDKLRFHDNDGQIIDEIEQLVADIEEFYVDEYNSALIDDLSTIFYNDVHLNALASEIITSGDYTDDGAFVYSLSSKYLATRKVDYAELRYVYALSAYPNWNYTIEEKIAINYIEKTICLLKYILKYSYRATYVKKLKATAKRPQYNRVKSKRPPRPPRDKALDEKFNHFEADEAYYRNKELLSSVYGTTAANSIDDNIGGFKQPNPIPCDGEDY